MRQEMILQYLTKDEKYGESICETRAQVLLVLNKMPEPKGLMTIRFTKTGAVKAGTRGTFLKAARNGILFEEDE